MNRVDKFLTLFSDFELEVKPVSRETEKKELPKATETSKSKAKSELKRELKRLNREYTRAKRSFKTNKITKQELFEFEWRIFEIHEELKRLDEETEE